MPSVTAVTDTFTAADNTNVDDRNTDSGHTWTETTLGGSNVNSAIIKSNKMVCGYSAGQVYYLSYVPQSPDYRVLMDATFTAGKTAGLTTTSNAYVEARKTADNTFTCYRFRANADGTASDNLEFRLQAVVNGSTSNFTSASTGTLTGGMIYYSTSGGVGSTFRFEIRVVGSTISGYVDGVLRCEGTHTGITAAGRPGMTISGNTTSKQMTFDNYQVIDLASAGQRNVSQAVTRSTTR